MKTKLGFYKDCPHCHRSIKLDGLRKIPFNGRLSWYQFTPSPVLACPKCDGLVEITGKNSKRILLVFIPIFVIIAFSFVFPRLKVMFDFPWGLVVFAWLYLGMKYILQDIKLMKKNK